MKRAMFTIVIFAIMMCSVVHASPIGISTGSTSGTYYQFGNDIKNACNCAETPITVLDSSGSLSNILRVFADKRVQYAIVQHDSLIYKGMTEPKEMEKIKMIFPFYNEEIHILTRRDANINSLMDLKGKNVSVGKENSGNWVTANIIKSKTGLTWNDVNYDPKASLDALILGDIDAMIYVAGKPIALFEKLDSSYTQKIKLININHPSLDGFYNKVVIPEEMYPWQKDSVTTYGVNAILITYDYMSQGRQEEIRSLVTCIMKNLPNFQDNAHAKWREVDPFSYTKVKWPVHSVVKNVIDNWKKNK